MDMSFIDHQIQEPDLKSEITSYILDDLPNWFGIEAAKKEYIENVRDKDFFVIHKKKEPEFKPNSPLGEELNFSEIEKIKSSLGFITLKYHSQYSAEVYVMGILKKYHRLGIGKKLIDTVSAHLKEHSYKFLTC